jgi:hypothetical protein
MNGAFTPMERRCSSNSGKWGQTPLATITAFKSMIPVSTEGLTPFPIQATVPE